MSSGDDVTRFTCPACGAGPNSPCEPLRSSPHPFTLRPHWQRGKTPHELAVLAARGKR